MSKSCKGLATELVKCLSESDCVKVENRPFQECASQKSPSISSECVGLRETYFNCKRGQVDMRARIRGNKGYQVVENLTETTLINHTVILIIYKQELKSTKPGKWNCECLHKSDCIFLRFP